MWSHIKDLAYCKTFFFFLLNERFFELYNALQFWGLPGSADVMKLTVMQEIEFDPELGKIPWEGNGNPLQSSCLESSCTDLEVTKSQT